MREEFGRGFTEYKNPVVMRDKDKATVSAIFKQYQVSDEINTEVECIMKSDDIIVCIEQPHKSLEEVPILKVISHITLTYNAVNGQYDLDLDEIRRGLEQSRKNFRNIRVRKD